MQNITSWQLCLNSKRKFSMTSMTELNLHRQISVLAPWLHQRPQVKMILMKIQKQSERNSCSPEAVDVCSTMPTFTIWKISDGKIKHLLKTTAAKQRPKVIMSVVTVALTPIKGMNFWQESSSGLWGGSDEAPGWNKRSKYEQNRTFIKTI